MKSPDVLALLSIEMVGVSGAVGADRVRMDQTCDWETMPMVSTGKHQCVAAIPGAALSGRYGLLCYIEERVPGGDRPLAVLGSLNALRGRFRETRMKSCRRRS